MTRKGFAFIDDLIDNAATILLLVIAFVIALLVVWSSQMTMKNNYNNVLDSYNHDQALIELLRMPGYGGQTIAQNLQHADSEVIRNYLDGAVKTYYEGVYGKQASWSFRVIYPEGSGIENLIVSVGVYKKDVSEVIIPIGNGKTARVIVQAPSGTIDSPIPRATLKF